MKKLLLIILMASWACGSGQPVEVKKEIPAILKEQNVLFGLFDWAERREMKVDLLGTYHKDEFPQNTRTQIYNFNEAPWWTNPQDKMEAEITFQEGAFYHFSFTYTPIEQREFTRIQKAMLVVLPNEMFSGTFKHEQREFAILQMEKGEQPGIVQRYDGGDFELFMFGERKRLILMYDHVLNLGAMID